MPDEAKIFFFKIAVVMAAFCLFVGLSFGQEATPTPGTPEELSSWLDEQPGTTEEITGYFDPVETFGGVYSAPRYRLKQNLAAGVAVEIEMGYTEVPSPIDPEKIGGLAYQGEVVTELTEPVLRGVLGDPRGPGEIEPGPRPRPTPEHAGPRPRPTRPPEVRPVPGGRDGQGREIRDVVISDRQTPGSVRRQARRVSGVRLVEPIEGPVKIERTPWHSSYSVRQGPVWLKLEVAE